MNGLRLRHAGTAALIGVLACVGCGDAPPPGHPGYVEAEYVDVAAPIAGRLDTLSVQRGDTVAAGSPLFALEAANEAAAVRQGEQQLKAAQAQLADLQQGRRLPEQRVTQAQLAQAEAEAQRSATQLARDEAQLRIGGISQAQLDEVRAAHAANTARAEQFRSELSVARLPARRDQIAAQSAQVAAARAALEQAAWRLAQKSVPAFTDARVVDTLFSLGEWVNAGSPVVRLLPPGHLKLRFFVPEPVLARMAVGARLAVDCDGCGAALGATLSYVASEAEYTPPVIFSNATRAKLVFMVEARPDAQAAPHLRAGLPVSVTLK